MPAYANAYLASLPFRDGRYAAVNLDAYDTLNIYGTTHYAPHRALVDPPYTTFPTGGYSDAVYLLADPRGEKGTVARCTVPKVASRLNADHVRAEVSWETERQGVRRVYAGSFMIRAADFIDVDTFDNVVMQIHDWPDTADSAGDPPVHIVQRGRNILVKLNGSVVATTATAGERNANLRTVASVPLLLDRWNSVVIDTTQQWWAPRVRVWINGALCCDERANVFYNDTEAGGAQYAGGNWVKHGAYAYLPGSVASNVVVYQTGLIQASGGWTGDEIIARGLIQ